MASSPWVSLQVMKFGSRAIIASFNTANASLASQVSMCHTARSAWAISMRMDLGLAIAAWLDQQGPSSGHCLTFQSGPSQVVAMWPDWDIVALPDQGMARSLPHSQIGAGLCCCHIAISRPRHAIPRWLDWALGCWHMAGLGHSYTHSMHWIVPGYGHPVVWISAPHHACPPCWVVPTGWSGLQRDLALSIQPAGQKWLVPLVYGTNKVFNLGEDTFLALNGLISMAE